MRDYTGVAPSTLPPPDAQDFHPRLRRMVSDIDYFLKDLSKGMARIQKGQIPDGSGNTIPVGQNGTLLDYLYLPGRLGGQEVEGLDPNPTVTLDQSVSGLSVNGSIGNPIFRLESGDSAILDFRPYQFDASVEVALTNGSGVGVGVNFPSNDGTSAFRIASTTNRTFLQCGLKNSSGQSSQPNMTLGGVGATVGSSLLYEFQRITLANAATVGALSSVVTARSTRVGVNARPDDFASSSGANQPGSLIVRGIGGSIITDPAPLIIQSESIGSLFPMIEIRDPPGGAPPSQTIGALEWQLDESGDMRWYSSGSRRGRLQPVKSGSGTGGFNFLNSSDRNLLGIWPATSAFADSVASQILLSGNNTDETRRMLICADGGNILSRLGICATSTIIGPRTSGALSAPVSSAIFTLLDSSANAVVTVGSTGTTTFTKNAVIDNVTASDVLLKLVPHASQSVDMWQVRNSGDSDNFLRIGSAGDLIVGSTGLANKITINVDTFGTDPAPAIVVAETTTGFSATFQTDATGFSANRTYTLPDTSGALLTGAGTALTTFQLRSSTSSSGASFRDQTTNSKQLRFVLSGAVGNNSITLSNTAARNYGFGNLSGFVPVVGDDPPAVASGALGKVDLTGQTAAIASTNLSSTPPAGLYRVDVYVACTTASGAGAPTLDVNIAWTDVVGATNRNIVADNSFAAAGAFPLSLAATGRSSASLFIQVASGDIAYSTTINAAAGTPAYAIYIRTTYMG